MAAAIARRGPSILSTQSRATENVLQLPEDQKVSTCMLCTENAQVSKRWGREQTEGAGPWPALSSTSDQPGADLACIEALETDRDADRREIAALSGQIESLKRENGRLRRHIEELEAKNAHLRLIAAEEWGL